MGEEGPTDLELRDPGSLAPGRGSTASIRAHGLSLRKAPEGAASAALVDWFEDACVYQILGNFWFVAFTE
jgi:hypothetical protein